MAKLKPMHVWDSIGLDIDSVQPWQIERYKSIAMGAFGWWGQNAIHLTTVLNDRERFAENPYDDYVVVKTLHALINEADIIVAHNGDAFDWKHFKARCAFHNIPIPKPVKMIDTMKIARKHFGRGAMGNSIDNLGRFLGVSYKSNSPDWHKIARADLQELLRCGKYCKQDVNVMKQIFSKMWDLGMIDNINLNPIMGTKNNCRACGRDSLIITGETYTNSHAYEQKQCTKCNTYQKGERIK